MIYGAWFLSEPITAGKLIGLAAIIAGSWLGIGGLEQRDSRVEQAAVASEVP